MSEIKPRTLGLRANLPAGSSVFCALSEDGTSACFRLTNTQGDAIRFALSEEALGAMVQMYRQLRAEDAGLDLNPAQRAAKLDAARQAHEIKPNVPLSWLWLLEWASGLVILPRKRKVGSDATEQGK